MKTLNNTTQQAQGFIRAYENTTDNTGELYQVYDTCSTYKYRAMYRCKELCSKLNGHSPRITGHNTFAFTYAFKYENENGQTCLAYITKDNNYSIPLN